MRRKPLHRLFFALRPPLAQAGRLAQLSYALPASGTRVSIDRLHLTVSLTEDYELFPASRARAMLDAGNAVRAEAFPVLLDQLVGGSRSIVARPRRMPDELRLFARQLDGALAERGVGRRKGSRFSPHVTLLYRDGDPFAAPVDPIGWLAEEFVLIHSIVGATRHIELGRWPLRPAAATLH